MVQSKNNKTFINKEYVYVTLGKILNTNKYGFKSLKPELNVISSLFLYTYDFYLKMYRKSKYLNNLCIGVIPVV